MRSASPLESRPLAHCAISCPPGGPVTSTLYASERTSIENFPSAALRVQVGGVDVDGGCAHTSASTTAAPFSSTIVPPILECGSRCTTLVASASSTSAHVLASANRVGAAGLTRTEYVPARRCNRAVPAALVSAQPFCAPASVKAQTFAPMTGAPAGPETTTASVRAVPDAAPGASDAGGAPAWHATTRAAKNAREGRSRRIRSMFA